MQVERLRMRLIKGLRESQGRKSQKNKTKNSAEK